MVQLILAKRSALRSIDEDFGDFVHVRDWRNIVNRREVNSSEMDWTKDLGDLLAQDFYPSRDRREALRASRWLEDLDPTAYPRRLTV